MILASCVGAFPGSIISCAKCSTSIDALLLPIFYYINKTYTQRATQMRSNFQKILAFTVAMLKPFTFKMKLVRPPVAQKDIILNPLLV